jgi:anaerobic selenocysteine-containing dehydrogenase
MPEEILSDHPERLRAVITSSSNPLRSYADTTSYEKAFKKLDLLVTLELAMTETAELAHYVLPARSGYEGWDGTLFNWTYPEIYFQMRRPIIRPEGEPLECGEIFTRLADGMGLIPEIPESLHEAAKTDRLTYAMELAVFAQQNPQALQRLPFVIAKTLGAEMGSAHLSLFWGVLQQMMLCYKTPDGKLLEPDDVFVRIADGTGMLPEVPRLLRGTELARHWLTLWALSRVRPSTFVWDAHRQGFTIIQGLKKILSPARLLKVAKSAVKQMSYLPLMQLVPTAAQAEILFKTIIDHPEGLWIAKSDPDNFKQLRTPNKKICVHIPELGDWVKEITPESEAEKLSPDPEYPFIMNAGSHMSANANTLMRNPKWNQKIRACTLLMNPDDARDLGLKDGQEVRIITEAGRERVELEVTKSARKGQLVLPHGFGLRYKGKVYGTNANRLTKNTNRDPLAGTPYHRFVPCRIEPL